jgi:tripartite-type tricarboxylate transporter receptor subunit TctC
MELFKSLTKVNVVRVPYSNITQGFNDVISGQAQLVVETGTTLGPHVKSGRLKALGVTSLQRSALFPDLPTIASSGVPGFEAASMYTIFAPANTPAPIVNRLNQEFVRALNTEAIKEKYLSSGVEVVASTPQELETATRSEMARWGKIISDAGIRAE